MKRWAWMGVVLLGSACTINGDDGDAADTDAMASSGAEGSGTPSATANPSGGGGGDGDGDSDATPTTGADETSGADESSGEPYVPEPIGTIDEFLTPHDTETADVMGPDAHGAMYGYRPQIIVDADGPALNVFAQDYGTPDVSRAVVLRLESTGDDWVLTQAHAPPMLDRVMGLAHEGDALYLASGIVEDLHQPITVEYPAAGEYRPGVVRVVQTDWRQSIGFDVDLDPARAAASDNPEQLINPMVASTARIAVGGGRLALVHGINTDPDDNDVRHQKALTTHLDATTGDVLRTSSIWVSHSFDQRVLHDGTGFIEAHLGDAFPRTMAFARVEPDSGTVPLMHIKGPTGANNTHARLGGVALLDDPTFGYVASFVTERTPGTDPLAGFGRVAGGRDVAVVRVRRDFETSGNDALAHLDPALPDTFTVDSAGTSFTNRVRWITDYGDDAASAAERLKLVALGDGTVVLLWERWDRQDEFTFSGTWGAVLAADGTVAVEPTMLASTHLPGGDDAVALGDHATWVTGVAASADLVVHQVDATLTYQQFVVE